MKRYKVSIDNGDYQEFSELPLCVREFIENCGCESGVIELPSVRYEFSVCPEQWFPENTIDNIHHVCAAIRTMVETLSEIDAVQFRQTIAVLSSSATRLTAAAKREHERNQVLNGDRIELAKDTIRKGQKLRDELNEASENESEWYSGLCAFHQGIAEPKTPLCPDCPECEKVIDRQNSEFEYRCEYCGNPNCHEGTNCRLA